MSTEPETYDVQGGVNEEGHYEALSKQPMSFHDALAELVDNSISASILEESYITQENPPGNFRIQITIERSGDSVDVIVADSGSGMMPDILADHVLTSGDNHGDGVLNEHGMGLKNALCVLTKNEGDPPFSIVTKTADSNLHAFYKGPFGDEKIVRVDDYTELWNEGTDYLSDPSKGTRIHFTTNFNKFNSTYPRAGSTGTIVEALREHLGVFYRHFLEYDQNHIVLRWIDSNRDEQGGPIEIIPIFPEFVENDPEPIHETLSSVVGNVQYHRGAINWEKTRKKYEEKGLDIIGTADDDSPFRIYYRKNKSTQGVNVVYNGRTIDTGAIERIWDNAVGFGDRDDETRGTIAAHSRYNDFAGEIIITDSRFETVNNKIGMNPDSERWQEVKDVLNADKKYHPIKRGREQREETYATRLIKTHENDTITERSYQESGEWGVKIDVAQLLETGDEQIYELKSGVARPQDVYQLVMYWDAYKRLDKDNDNLIKGILVAEKITGNAKKILNYWNERRTSASGDSYNLEFKTLNQLNISDDTYTEVN